MINYNSMTSADKAIFISNSIAKHGGKMAGIPSISTSALNNEFCTSCTGCGLAAKHCYAKKYLRLRPTLAEKCARNTEFYTTVNLTDDDVPTINASIFRFESFGELQNVQQLKNYCTIAEKNEHCRFVLWTKRTDILQAFDRAHNYLPDNFSIVLSSPVVNESYDVYELTDMWLINMVSAVFTVYTKEYAEKHNIKINCGGNKCLECGRCYSLDHSKIIFINELLK